MNDIDWEEVQMLRDAGARLVDLAKKYGVSAYKIGYHTEQLKMLDKVDWGTAQALRDAGWTLTEIGNYIDVEPHDVEEHTKPAKPKRVYENEWNANNPYHIIRGNELI